MRKENFDILIFKSYSQDKNYDRLRHNLHNIRESMLKRHESFKKLSLKMQFEYCETIGVIAVHTQLQHMNENRPLSHPEKKVYSYSIDRNWKEIKPIEITDTEHKDLMKVLYPKNKSKKNI